MSRIHSTLVVLLVVFFGYSQNLISQHSISGRVTNLDGEPLELAAVFLQGSSYGTVSDANGNFRLDSIPEGEYELKATYVGYRSVSQWVDVITDMEVDLQFEGELYELDEIEISVNRLDEKSIFSYEDVDMEQMKAQNLGQDLPVLLDNTIAAVSTSDAGAGIGYTGLRLRGSDQTRLNVTLNGVPWNDSESHGVFYVNLPDLASDASSIQIQRGVGTSTNGAVSFGGSVSVNTHETHVNPYVSVGGGIGSFGTKRLSAKAGTGLLNDAFSVDLRYSLIDSDGFIDRASSDLSSFSASFSRISDYRSLRFDILLGSEKTYQAWNGVPEAKFKGDAEGLLKHYGNNVGSAYNTRQDSINLFDSPADQYNYYRYPGQVDNYKQNHYQLHWSEVHSEQFTGKTTLFYTKGSGYFEEFKYQDDLADYDISSLTDTITNEEITEGNVIRRRWLDNHYFGLLYNAEYQQSKTLWQFGGGWSQYLGDHFGRVIGVERTKRFSPRQYYFGEGDKNDGQLYAKATIDVSPRLQVFGDMQYRRINYTLDGEDNDGQIFDIDETYNFLNPKLGLSYQVNGQGLAYASYARGSREPVRSDFTDHDAAKTTPTPEYMDNIEVGYRSQGSKLSWSANVYHMQYKDQLIPTGELNDVGAALRRNVASSFRQGIELSAGYQATSMLNLTGNLALSNNKIESYDDVVYDYTNGYEVITTTLEDTDIALSPNVVANAIVELKPVDGLRVALINKYVGKQYLDNTSNEDRVLDAYLVNHLNASYDMKLKGVKNIRWTLQVNNLFDQRYAANGYTYSYISGDKITENFYFPQAGINFLLGAKVDL